MDTDRIAGAAKQAAGKAENVIGDVFNDARTRAQGAGLEAEGLVQNVVGQAKDAVRNAGDVVSETVQDRPGGSLLMAGLIGIAIGYVLAKGSQPPRPPRYWDRYRFRD